MELLNTIRLSMQDAARAERLMADERFVASLRRDPTAALRTFALAHPWTRPEGQLRRVERSVLLRRIA